MFREDFATVSQTAESGLSENSLFDSWGRRHSYLRIAVTDRCNLRCRYCIPQSGVNFRPQKELLTAEEIARLAELLVAHGIEKIRLTGGEPLVRGDIIPIIQSLKQICPQPTLAMTSNAVLLENKVQSLKEAGIEQLNLSLDTLKEERFKAIAGHDQFAAVYKGLRAAIDCRFESLKLNVVIMAGINDDEILEFVALAQRERINVRFIECMPFKDNQWKEAMVLASNNIKNRIERQYKLVAAADDLASSSKTYSITGGGKVSFISAMSDSFCSSCNRLRLTADGSLKSCLFYPPEVSLRDAMRAGASNEELMTLVRAALAIKPKSSPIPSEIDAEENRSMIDIGG